MAKYPDVVEGQWLQPTRMFKMACCDCGLVHVMQFRIVKGKIQMRAFRHERATAQIRRHRNIRIKHDR